MNARKAYAIAAIAGAACAAVIYGVATGQTVLEIAISAIWCITMLWLACALGAAVFAVFGIMEDIFRD